MVEKQVESQKNEDSKFKAAQHRMSAGPDCRSDQVESDAGEKVDCSDYKPLGKENLLAQHEGASRSELLVDLSNEIQDASH